MNVKLESKYATRNVELSLTTLISISGVHTFTFCCKEYIVASKAYIYTLKLDGIHPLLRKIVRNVDVLKAEVTAADEEA